MKEAPLALRGFLHNKMNKIVVYSDSPYSGKELPSISVKEVENSKVPVVLVIVKENSADKMESLSNMLEIRSPVSLEDYKNSIKENSDKEYLFKEGFVSSAKRVLFGFFPANANMMAPAF